MFDILATYGTDTALEVSGKKVFADPQHWFLIARDGNKSYNALVAKLYQDQKFVLEQKNEASEAAAQALTVDAMAQTILVGWGDDVGLNGQTMEYSVENAKLLLGVKDFRDWVAKQSKDFANYKLVVAEATAKN